MTDDNEVTNLGAKSLDDLDLSPKVKQALLGIVAEMMAAYQRSFVEMLETMRRQSSALDRLQTTLGILIENVAPDLKNQIPATIRVARSDEEPDLTSTVVVADPIGAGYTMSQADIARALNLPAPDVNVLVKGFKLADDDECAIDVRSGTKHRIVNYHPKVLLRFKELLANPPAELNDKLKPTLERVRQRLSAAGLMPPISDAGD